MSRGNGAALVKRGVWLFLPVLLAGMGLFRCGGGGASPALADGKSWSAPERIGDNVTELHYPAVAVDNAGNAVAAWARGPLAVIHSSRFSIAQGSWGVQEPIGTESPDGAWEPSLSADSAGRVLAVWYQMESPVNVYSRRFSPGTGWDGAPVPVETGSADAYFPQVSLNGAGNGVAVWEQGGSVLASRYDGTAGSWQAAETISASVPGTAGLPGMPGRGNCIRVDEAGNAHAVWKQSDGGVTHIRWSRFDGAAWGDPERIDADPGSSDDPSLALDGSGGAVVVWSQADGSGTRSLLWVRRYRATAPGGWDSPVLLDNVAGRADKPQIAADGSGNRIAVWRRQEVPGGAKALFGARFVPAQGWGGPIRLSGTDLPDGELWPALAVEPSGTAVAAWEQPEVEGGPSRVWARRFAGDAGWEDPVPVSLPGLGDADEPAVGMDGAGNAVLVWKQKDTPETSVQSIWASRLR